MLFRYIYVHHTIEKLQEWMEHLFMQVWCTANPEKEFDIEMLQPELREITLEIYYNERIKKDYLHGPIERIYKIFQGFDQKTKSDLAKAYQDNNSVEDLCRRTNNCNPFLYTALRKIHEELGTELEKFCKLLFTDIIDLTAVKSRIGHLDEHYDRFMTENSEGKCPFCGINNLKGIYVSKRDAYDHYLPKDLYPFNSVNLSNLAPMCHDCNSSYKGARDPIYNRRTEERRKAFYPYSQQNIPFTFSITLTSNDIAALTPDKIDIYVDAEGYEEEVEAWKETFGIEERYKAICLAKHYGMAWYIEAIEEYENAKLELGTDITKSQWVQRLINVARRNRYADVNFLKAEFLEECRRIGAFGDI